jgi:hypothetical protein
MDFADYLRFPGRHPLPTRIQARHLERAVPVPVPDLDAVLPWPDTHLRLVARRLPA